MSEISLTSIDSLSPCIGPPYRYSWVDPSHFRADLDNGRNFHRENGYYPLTHYRATRSEERHCATLRSLQHYLCRRAVYRAAKRPLLLPHQKFYDTYHHIDYYYKNYVHHTRLLEDRRVTFIKIYPDF